MSQDSPTQETQAFFTEEERKETKSEMDNRRLEEVLQLCMLTLQAAAQNTTHQVARRPPTFAVRPKASAEDFLSELTAYLVDKRVGKEDWPYILVEQLLQPTTSSMSD